jgi:hypothetical protein
MGAVRQGWRARRGLGSRVKRCPRRGGRAMNKRQDPESASPNMAMKGLNLPF